MRFLNLVYQKATRRPIRSALAVCAMVIDMAAVVALVGIADSFQRSLLDLSPGQWVDATLVIPQGFAIVILIGLMGAIGPAVRAVRLMPSVALRNEG